MGCDPGRCEAGTGQYGNVQFVGIVETAKCVGERGGGWTVDGVAHLGPVDGDDCATLFDFESYGHGGT